MDAHPPDPAPRDRLEQVVLDDYRLTSVLGRGSFATAYLADDLVSGHRVVVKIAHADLCRDSRNHHQVVRRFEAEFEAMTRFDHPNVALMFELDAIEHGVPALVMEYVRGSALRELLEATSLLDESMTAPIFEQLFSVLAAAHEAGVVHRDVSPDNVMVTHDPAEGVVIKLLDFGVARVADQERFTMGPVGTPRYMAPEQILGKPSPASDMFSAGALLWWACTGQPYRAEAQGLHELLVGQIEQTRVPDPRQVHAGIDRGIAALLQALLAPVAERRPDAAEALARWQALSPRQRRTIDGTLGDEILVAPDDTDFPFVEALKQALDAGKDAPAPRVVDDDALGGRRAPGVPARRSTSGTFDTSTGAQLTTSSTGEGFTPASRVGPTPRRRTDDKHPRSGIYASPVQQRAPRVHFVLLESDAFVRRALVRALEALPGALDGVGTATAAVQRLMALGGRHAIVLVPTGTSARDVALLRADMYRHGLDSSRALIVAVRWSHETLGGPVGVDADVCIEDARALADLPELFVRRSLTGLVTEELPVESVLRSDSFAVVERPTTGGRPHARLRTGEHAPPPPSSPRRTVGAARRPSGVHARPESQLHAFVGQMPEWLLELADAWSDPVHCSGLLTRIEHGARRVGALALSEQTYWLSQSASALDRTEFLEHVDALEALYIEFSRDALRGRR